MWEYGHHFHTKDVDNGHITKDCGEEVEIDQSSHASHCDQNMIQGKLGYVRKIQEIIQVDFSFFQCVIFRCKWWDTFDRNNVNEDHDNGLICINRDVLDNDWWFVLRHDPRSKHIFKNNSVIMPSEEDIQGANENEE